MRQVEVTIEGISPYSQSRQHGEPFLEKEGHDDYDRRTWREKCTSNDAGEVVIPAMALKQALDKAASRIGMKIPGKRNSTYTKHFLAGVICEEDVPTGIKKDEIPSIRLSVNADGKRGSGKRVMRTFPQTSKWGGVVRFAVLDDTITQSVFTEHLNEAGRFVGVGRFRPENGGLNGRFRVVDMKWTTP